MFVKSLLVPAFAAWAAAQGEDLATTLQNNENLSALAELIGSLPQETVSMLNNMKDITVLAPTNEALGMLLNTTEGEMMANDPAAITALLTYHVLNGTYMASDVTNTSAFIPTMLTDEMYANVTGGQVVNVVMEDDEVMVFSGLNNNVTVVDADIEFNGGVVHAIDMVLTIPPPAKNIILDAGLSSLYGALNFTDLLDTVSGLTDVTIFAPMNDAFAAISSEFSDMTEQDLASILQYHVHVGDVYYSTDIVDNVENGTSISTLSDGNEVTIYKEEDGIYVNNAKVMIPDVLIAGGVVHVIDAVLNPMNSTAKSNGEEGEDAFEGASSMSDAPYTSDLPMPSTTVGMGPGQTADAQGNGEEGGDGEGAAPRVTGVVGVAALFGAGAIMAAL